jgi:PEP-CTERM motif
MRTPSTAAAWAVGLALIATLPNALAATDPPLVDHTLVIEFSNQYSADVKGSAENTTLVYRVAPQAWITGLSWSVTATAFDPSWLSELTLDLSNSLGEGVQLSPADGINNAGSLTTSGQLDLVNSGLGFRLRPDGRLKLEFYDAFDDLAGAPDGRWSSGLLQVHYLAAAVPEPASAGLLLAGLLAAAGWHRAGRRRQAVAPTPQA